MSKENSETIKVYDETTSIYLANSLEHDRLDPVRAEEKKKELEQLIELSFAGLPKKAKVFEIGSCDGQNAKFIESLGFDITASDPVDGFVEETRKTGVKTIKFDALEDEFKEKYFAIFCWRVFVHFTKEDALRVIEKAYDALEDDGIFLFNAINREEKDVDSEWVDFAGEYHMGKDRYYSYFRQSELDEIVGKTKFQISSFHKEGGKNNNKWLVYTLKK